MHADTDRSRGAALDRVGRDTVHRQILRLRAINLLVAPKLERTDKARWREELAVRRGP